MAIQDNRTWKLCAAIELIMSAGDVVDDVDVEGSAEEAAISKQQGRKAPDGGWGWWVVFGSFMIHVITDGITYSFGVFYDEFLTYFNEGKGPTAWILSILVGVTFCSGPISSLMVNRWGCRVVTIIGAILASVCLAVSLWAKNIAMLYVTIGLGTGFGFGLIYLPAIISVSTYFETKRSLATGIAVCGSGFGTFIFAPIITVLVEKYGWQTSMMFTAAVVLSCIIFGALFRPLDDDSSEDKTLSLRSTTGKMSLQIGSYSNYYLASGSTSPNKLQRAKSTAELSSYGAIPNEVLASTRSEGGACNRARRILDQKDLFFTRSIQSLEGSAEPILARSFRNSRRNCFGETKDTLMQLMDVSLLYDSIFIIFSISNFLTSIGFNIPYVYIVSRAKGLGISPSNASLILSVIGIANTVGRIVLGYISDKTWVNRLWVYNTCLTLCGIATALSCFCSDFYSLVVYASIYGFLIGAYVGLTSVILVDLLGLDKLTNAFGLLLLFQGIASLIGPPIAGVLYDVLKSYDPGFMVAGVTIALSGLILFFIPCIQRRRSRKNAVCGEHHF